MTTLKIVKHPEIESRFNSYPAEARKHLLKLREIIIDAAQNMENIDSIEETLKWGEPSYITKKGSTVRINWNPKTPDQYSLYFICNTCLVETFKIVYGDVFSYEKNRAIHFSMNEDIPIEPTKACIRMALSYHTIKNKPLLGN